MIPSLYIVATPIGTISDISPRALEILSRVDIIFCEDTRQTQKLLAHHNIRNNLKSLHAHNEKSMIKSLDEAVVSGHASLALVCDAGTPTISDPGALFVAAAHKKNFTILSVPGPSSLTSALAACGFAAPRSLFVGFLPRSEKEQEAEFFLWQSIAPCVIVGFESPRRILRTLVNMAQFFPKEVELCLSREISKKFEEHLRGSLDEVKSFISAKNQILGEFVFTLHLKNNPKKQIYSIEDLSAFAKKLSISKSIPLKEACKNIAIEYNSSGKDIYNACLEKGSF